jgi:hypothetical protein
MQDKKCVKSLVDVVPTVLTFWMVKSGKLVIWKDGMHWRLIQTKWIDKNGQQNSKRIN